MRTQQKDVTRLLCRWTLGFIRTTVLLYSALLLAYVGANHRSSSTRNNGLGVSSCGREFPHPDPESCTGFLVLRIDCSSNSQVTVQRRQCPLGLLFHRLTSTCEFPWNADCRLSHSVAPSIPIPSHYSTTNRKSQFRPTANILSVGNTIESKSSTGSYVSASTELVGSTTDFKIPEPITNHANQSGFTVLPLFSVTKTGSVNRQEYTKSSELIITSSAKENKSDTSNTVSIAFKTHPSSEATIHHDLNDSVATMTVVPSTSAADSAQGIGTTRDSENSVRLSAQGEITNDAVLQTQLNLKGERLKDSTATPVNSITTVLQENIRKPFTMMTMLAESSISAEYISTEKEAFITSQDMHINIYSTAFDEYSHKTLTENVTSLSKSGTAETTSWIGTGNIISRAETIAERETAADVSEYFHSPTTAEIFTTEIITKDYVIVTVDESDSFTGVTESDGVLTTKHTGDNSTLVTSLFEVNGTQTMTAPEGNRVYHNILVP